MTLRSALSVGANRRFQDQAREHAGACHRKAAARLLAEAGCTEHEIAAITGHASLREIARYTKAADQQRPRPCGHGEGERKTGTETVKPWRRFDN
jgi:hypothetical protein